MPRKCPQFLKIESLPLFSLVIVLKILMSYLNYDYAAAVKTDLESAAFVEVNVVDEAEDEDV